jgi:YD repeat-containing protein
VDGLQRSVITLTDTRSTRRFHEPDAAEWRDGAYTSDAASRVTGISYANAGGSLGTLTYSYDANGRRTIVGGTWARTGLPQSVTDATYNANNQPVTFNGQPLTFDLNGDLTSDGVHTYTWNARHQMVGIETFRQASATTRSAVGKAR